MPKFVKCYGKPGRPSDNYGMGKVAEMLDYQKAGMTYEDLAAKYNVSKSTVSRMLRYARELKEYT